MFKRTAKYSEFVPRYCSCSSRRELPSDIFLKILKGDSDLLKEWLPHMTCFITEMPFPWIVGSLKEADATFEIIEKINNFTPVVFRDPERMIELKKYIDGSIKTKE